jgi:predicted transcriptional regulator
MTTAKQMVLDAVHRLPEEASFRDIAEEVAFLAALREGHEDLSQGRVVSNEEMKQRLVHGLQNNLDGALK